MPEGGLSSYNIVVSQQTDQPSPAGTILPSVYGLLSAHRQVNWVADHHAISCGLLGSSGRLHRSPGTIDGCKEVFVIAHIVLFVKSG